MKIITFQRGLKKNVKLVVFKEMYHGFLNFAGHKGFGLEEATIAVRLIRRKMNDYFDGKLSYQMANKIPL